jgi:hypothetical protein
MKTIRRDWLKRRVDAGKMEACTVFNIERDGTGANDVYGGDWKPARIRRPTFREHYPDKENRPDWHYSVCAHSHFIDGKMNFNESDFRSGSGACYQERTCADGRPIYCLHIHSNAVYNFRPIDKPL